MTSQENNLYEFGPYRLDAQERVLTRDGQVVPLAPKTLDLLIALVEESGRVLGNNDQSFFWLEKAYKQHENMTLVKTDEDFNRLRSDPAFTDRLRRLGITP